MLTTDVLSNSVIACVSQLSFTGTTTEYTVEYHQRNFCVQILVPTCLGTRFNYLVSVNALSLSLCLGTLQLVASFDQYAVQKSTCNEMSSPIRRSYAKWIQP